MAPPVPAAVDAPAVDAPVMNAAADDALSSYDEWAVELYKLQRTRIAEVCPDLYLRETRLQRAKVSLFFHLLGSPNLFGALRRAGVLPDVNEAPATPPADKTGTVFLSDEDRAARLYAVQRDRITVVWADSTQREARLLRAHDALLRNLRLAARARCQAEKRDGSQA